MAGGTSQPFHRYQGVNGEGGSGAGEERGRDDRDVTTARVAPSVSLCPLATSFDVELSIDPIMRPSLNFLSIFSIAAVVAVAAGVVVVVDGC